jgi:hypothetical protein
MDSVQTNIEEYYNNSEDKDVIPFEEFKLMCITPFKMVRKTFTSGNLIDIRLQYFGVFEVSTSRIKYSKRMVEQNYNNKLISEKKYNERMSVLNSYESKSEH